MSELDMLYHNVSGHFFDSAVETDLLHQLTHRLESALAHTKVSVRSFFLGLAVLFLCFLLLLRLSPRSLLRNPARIAHARKILHALLTIITPTQSVWPRQYVNLAYRAAALLESLPLLFRGALATDTDPSMSFTFSVDGRWASRSVQDRRMKCTISAISSVQPTPGPHAHIEGVRPGSAPCCSLFLHVFHQDMPSVSLDCVHPAQLPSHLEQLKATLAPGAFLMLGLTTLASTATQHQARIASLPFLPRKATPSPSRVPSGSCAKPVQRSATPLRTSLTQVIDMLKSGRAPVRVEVVQNVSREYAEFMHGYVDGLEQDAGVRTQFVREWGMEAWVEERLCTVWEAALVEVGLLEAWSIVVCRPE